jgi:hypothetical protein
MNYYEEEEQYMADLDATKPPAVKPYTTKRGDRFMNLKNITLVVVYSTSSIIKLMPIKKDAIIEVYDRYDFIQMVNEWKMIPVVLPKVTRENVSEVILEFQFNILGKTMSDTDQTPKWLEEWTFNKKEKQLVKSFALATLKKLFKFNGAKARDTYDYFDKFYGLKIRE